MQRPMTRRATLAEVAAKAGVTKSVASRVINNRETITVRPETRERIIAAAQELGYRPHAMARALAVSETRLITMLMPDLSNPVYDRILQGALSAASQHDYILMLLEAEESGDYPGFATLLHDGRTDGVIVGACDEDLAKDLLAWRIPHVFVNRQMPDSKRNVTIDNEAASAIAVRHLVELGHQWLVHVDGHLSISTARSRDLGFARTCRELGLPDPRSAHADFTEAGGAEAMAELLASGQRPTAVYVGNIRQATGVLSALQRAGLRIPEDVSVLCADDLPGASFTIPPLTALQLPFRELGAAAITALLEQLHGGDRTDIVLDVPDSLTERGSTAHAS